MTVLRQIYRERWGYYFITPTYLLTVLFAVAPVVMGVYFSLYRTVRGQSRYVGFDNYLRLFREEAFQRAIENTLYFVLLIVPLALAISLFLAVLVSPLGTKAQTFFRIAFYLPVVASPVVLSLVWLWIYNPVYGLLNYLLKLVGLPPRTWLSDLGTALPGLAVIVITWSIGQPLILFLAAIGAVPRDYYEAAIIDGGNAWQRFWHITLPLIQPTTLFVLITNTIGVFQIWVVIHLMTQGGPFYATQSLVYLLYQKAFVAGRFGEASALGVLLFVIIMAIAYIQFRFFSRSVEY
ncbi:MAG: sugar ABC transporter permease [Deinococcus sp.]|nr:sugar ABC transporter permease [Deinococcus sp.]